MSWRTYAVIGCTHGRLLNEPAFAAALKRIEDLKPNMRIHLGDGLNAGAFYSKKPEPEDMELDVRSFESVIERFRPHFYLNGNHCDRYWRGVYSADSVKAYAAKQIVEEVSRILKRNRVSHHREYRIDKPGVRLGNVWFMHGFMYGAQALQQHAATFGNTVFAHLHTASLFSAKTFDRATAMTVGWMGDPGHEGVNYAKSSPQLLGWRNAFGWGAYDTEGVKQPEMNLVIL